MCGAHEAVVTRGTAARGCGLRSLGSQGLGGSTVRHEGKRDARPLDVSSCIKTCSIAAGVDSLYLTVDGGPRLGRRHEGSDVTLIKGQPSDRISCFLKE